VICSGEGLRPARLAERLHIAPRSLTDVLDALEEAGLIRRSPDPLDRRAQILTATADGRAMQQRLEEVRDRAAEEVFASLLPDERDRLGGLLRRVAGPRAG
jgi:DNA-binding MarR family transcriptional regulator